MWFICRNGFQTHPSRGLQPHVLMFIFFWGVNFLWSKLQEADAIVSRHPELTARCLCHNCWRWRWLHSPIAGAFWEVKLKDEKFISKDLRNWWRLWCRIDVDTVDFERLGNIKSLICPYLFFDSVMKHRRGFDFVALKSKKSTTTFSICIVHAEA